jgi:hypothetical protein
VTVIKEQTSLYFYKCVDIIHVLKLISEVRFIKSYKEFWFKAEDLLMRVKKDLSLTQLVEVSELYSQMERGSHYFWDELETLFITNSSSFK